MSIEFYGSNVPTQIGIVTNVTYAQALALQTAGTIVPGALYRMTDFQTIHIIPNTAVKNTTNTVIPIEVLILTGQSTTTFEKHVQSESFPNDIIEYTTDNTAWKDLVSVDSKGCITLRIDPLRNIEVGNGDWRNFIVRRWAADLSAYGRGAIRWVLWNTAVNCGITSSGVTQTFNALDLTLYNAVTNPDGYKDVRLFTIEPLPTRSVENFYIKSQQLGDGSQFLMPNFYCDLTTATPNILNNVNLPTCENVTVTDEVYELNLVKLENTIFADICGFENGAIGYYESTFIAMVFNGAGIIGNFSNVTIFDDKTGAGGSGGRGATYLALRRTYISILPTADAGYQMIDVIIQNTDRCMFTIQKGYAKSFKINGCSFTSVLPSLGSNFKDFSAYTTNQFYNPECKSTFETTLAAIAALVLSTSTVANVLDYFSGVINLTGAGTVNVTTLTRVLGNNFPVILKPVAGLTISIATNNVTNGFTQANTVTANGTNGEQIILFPTGDRWIAYGKIVTAPGAVATYLPADPATTTDTTGVMMGLGVSFIPTKSGNVLCVITGDIDNDTGGDGSQVQIRFGTGAIPANGAALSGTIAGSLVKMVNPNAVVVGIVFTVGVSPFALNSLLPLTVGVANWIDISLASITGGVSRVRDISVTLFEQ